MEWSLAHDSITGEEYIAVNQDFIDALVAGVYAALRITGQRMRDQREEARGRLSTRCNP